MLADIINKIIIQVPYVNIDVVLLQVSVCFTWTSFKEL